MTEDMKTFILTLTCIICTGILQGQIGINDNGSSPDNSAILDIKSSSKGMLIPCMTRVQIEAITNPADGLHVFCTTDDKLYIFISTESAWKEVLYGTGTIVPGGMGTCGQPFPDSRDGKTYSTVIIGTQCWMAQNLNYQTGNSWCYNDNTLYCNTYGRLYDWQTALGACPSGWHLPSDAEWTILANFLGGEGIAGGKMKETGTTHWTSPNVGATNSSGFTGLPGGYRLNYGSYGIFYSIGDNGYFQSSTEYTKTLLWSRILTFQDSELHKYYYSKEDMAISVRCLRD
jgi:uncharacterized protein (TIGR02145 family)